jgi:uncharacterized protein YjiS (DUF1127 family)
VLLTLRPGTNCSRTTSDTRDIIFPPRIEAEDTMRIAVGAGGLVSARQCAETFVATLEDLTARWSCWRERSRQRRALASFDARALADIGLTRLDAMLECEKPFWRP